MTMPNSVRKSLTLTASLIAGFAIAGGTAPVSAQTALFSSTVSIFGASSTPLATSTFTYNKTELNPQEFGYTLLTLEASITTPFVTRSYTLADLTTYAAEIQTLSAFIPASYQSLAAPYLAAVNTVINGTLGFNYVGDGDFPPPNTTLTFTAADLPTPPPLFAPFVAQLFPTGGQITFTSTVDGLPDARSPLTFTPASLAAFLAAEVPTVTRPLPDFTTLLPPGTDLPPALVGSAPSGDNASAAPEPATLLGAGLAAGAAAIARRRKQAH